MIRKLALGLSLLCASFATPPAQAQPQGHAMQTPPPLRKIPGITAPDRYPQGCVDCHINNAEMKLDTRFSTLMNRWSEKVEPGLLAKAQASAPKEMILRGKHPKATSALKDVPAKCLVCHGKTSKIAPPFANMIHTIHLTGGGRNHFLTVFQGECTYCHKLDSSSGHWTLPSAPEK
jgi:hypothetical protein